MNFFKSILSDDPEPTNSQNPHDSESDSPSKQPNDVAQDTTSSSPSTWSFGDLIQTIATRSESVIETYRKDLQEFSTGLKNESQLVREVANRAVKDLPTSIEAGKSALDGVLKSTAEIISKETLFFGSDNEPDTPENKKNSGRYSWFEMQLSLIGSDEATFCEEPEDLEEYRKWRSGFELEEKSDEIEDLIGENGVLEAIYIRVVPSVVDDETFWCRYFYRVEKLKVQEKVRANLVKRAIVVDDEEELSWDVDDDEEDEDKNETNEKGKNVVGDEGVSGRSLNDGQKHEGSKKDVSLNVESGDKSNAVEKSSEIVEEVKAEEVGPVKSGEKVVKSEDSSKKDSEDVALDVKEVKTEEIAPVKSAEEVKSEENVEKKNDENVVEEKVKVDSNSDAGASKMEEEEDMGWDEIENIGSDDEKKLSATTGSGSPDRAELRKRLSVADDEDEDLSWDIEDDDEPAKA